jgi:yecA family protein
MTDETDYLQPEELDKLQTTLVEHMQTSRSLPLDAAHGFFSAVAALPQELSASAARAHVLGEIAGEQGIEPLLIKFQAQVLRDLESGDYGPLIMQMPRQDGTSLPLPYGWCEGYAQGLAMLGEDLQAQALESQEISARLSPIFAFMMYDEEQMFDPPDEAAHREAVSELGEAVVFIYRWWHAHGHGRLQ